MFIVRIENDVQISMTNNQLNKIERDHKELKKLIKQAEHSGTGIDLIEINGKKSLKLSRSYYQYLVPIITNIIIQNSEEIKNLRIEILP